MIFASLIVIAFFGLGFLLINRISGRRNWARILLLVLMLFGTPFAIPAYLQEVRKNVLFGTLSIIITILQLLGTYFLFTRNSNLWFRKRK
jgi:disulfide bond formation protein DsbB